MKKILLFTICVLSFSLFANAQNCNLVVFAEEGERFQVVLNGVAQNGEHETHVRISELRANRYQIKILFEDQANGEITRNMEVMPNMEYTFKIKKKSKPKDGQIYALRFFGEVPIAQAPPPAATERVIVYHSEPLQQTTISQSTTTTTTTTGGGMPDENVNINMSIGGSGVGVNINTNTNMTESYSQTTTTTTTTSHGSGGEVVQHVEEGPCARPMTAGEFGDAKRSIGSKDFEDTKLKVAQQITSANCLMSDQVREIMMMFDFEDTKLEFAKFAYQYTYDHRNYYKVNDAFEFESSIEELDAHLGR